MWDDNKRPDGTTLVPWARGKPMAWDVTVPDTYAESHIVSASTKPAAAVQKAAQNKSDKYSRLSSTHIFYPIADTWHDTAIELTQEIGRCDNREMAFLFQCRSIAVQRENEVSFQNTMKTTWTCRRNHLHCLASISKPIPLCWWAM